MHKDNISAIKRDPRDLIFMFPPGSLTAGTHRILLSLDALVIGCSATPKTGVQGKWKGKRMSRLGRVHTRKRVPGSAPYPLMLFRKGLLLGVRRRGRAELATACYGPNRAGGLRRRCCRRTETLQEHWNHRSFGFLHECQPAVGGQINPNKISEPYLAGCHHVGQRGNEVSLDVTLHMPRTVLRIGAL